MVTYNFNRVSFAFIADADAHDQLFWQYFLLGGIQERFVLGLKEHFICQVAIVEHVENNDIKSKNHHQNTFHNDRGPIEEVCKWIGNQQNSKDSEINYVIIQKISNLNCFIFLTARKWHNEIDA